MTYDTSDFLSVPAELMGRPEAYYSRRSGLILLAGPKGPLLAHYIIPRPPDPTNEVFFVQYASGYNPFAGRAVPDERPENVTAIAHPLPRSSNPRIGVFSGASPALGGVGGLSDLDVHLMPPMADAAVLDQGGMRIGPSSIDAHADHAGYTLDAEGLHLNGKLHLNMTTTRGATAESPLFGILPKTAVTFWAADYLPTLETLYRVSAIIARVVRVTTALYSLSRILLRHVGSADLNTRLDRFENRVDGWDPRL